MFFVSVRFSQLLLKLGLTVVFLWFGIHKFLDPVFWANVWVPQWIVGVLSAFKLTSTDFVYIVGVFEILVGMSLVTGVGVRLFSFLASIFLVLIILTFTPEGVSEIIIRDVGLLGGFLALMFWPEQARA